MDPRPSKRPRPGAVASPSPKNPTAESEAPAAVAPGFDQFNVNGIQGSGVLVFMTNDLAKQGRGISLTLGVPTNKQ